jgi:hypothetical protein
MVQLNAIPPPRLAEAKEAPSGQVEIHEWTNKAGRTIKAKFVKGDAETVTIFTNDRDFTIKLSDLSPESQALARKLSAPPASDANIPPQVTIPVGIERDYRAGKLTEAQEKIVIALAQKQGVAKVAKISTIHFYPSAARGIRVDGAKETNDREVSFKVLSVNFKPWFHPGGGPRKEDVQMGDFWAGKPRTQKKTILRVGETDYLCGSIRDIEIKECEAMLGLFLAGKFTYTPGFRINDKLLGQVDWNKPSRFSKRGDAISVGFPHKGGPGSGFFDLEVEFVGGKLNIRQMFQAIP